MIDRLVKKIMIYNFFHLINKIREYFLIKDKLWHIYKQKPNVDGLKKNLILY